MDVGSLLVRSYAQFIVSGGTLTVSDSINSGSPMTFLAGDWSFNLAGGFGDLTNSTFADIHQASFASQPGTLTIFPAGFDPSQFASYASAGLAHVAGSPLTIPAGQSIAGHGAISDHLVVYGTLTRSDQYYDSAASIQASGGVEVHAEGDFNLGSGTLTVNDLSSGLFGGSLKAAKLYIGNGTTGRFVQTGGAFDDGDNTSSGPEIYVGYGSGGDGYYELSGGTIHVQRIRVGKSGVGLFRQLGGDVTLGFSSLASVEVGPGGVYEMQGGTVRSASLDCSNRFEQTGGTATTTGDVVVPGLPDQAGIFELSGGTHYVNGNLVLAQYPDSRGTYRVRGDGDLHGNRVWVGPETGVNGQGTFDVSGGSVSCRQLVVGRGLGVGELLLNNATAGVTVSELLEFGRSAHLSAVPGATIHVTGANVKNSSTDPTALDGLGRLHLVAEGGSSILTLYEVGGQNLGTVLDGLHENFALNTLSIGGSKIGRLKLVDAFDNQADGQLGNESLYLHLLELGPGSYLDLNGLTMYYQTSTIDPSATIVLNGGHLTVLPVPEPSTLALLSIAAMSLLAARRRWR